MRRYLRKRQRHPHPAGQDSGLYRTRITVAQPYDWTRLQKLGVLVLEDQDLSGVDT